VKNIYATFIVLGLSVSFLQAAVNFSFSTGMKFYDPQLNYSEASVLAAEISFALNSSGDAGLGFQVSNPVIDMSSPTGVKAISLTIWSLTAHYKTTLVHDFLSLKLEPLVSVGWEKIYRPAYTLNIGAVGSRTITSAHESFLLLTLATRLVKELSQHVGLFLKPAYSLFDTKHYYQSFSISGGFDVRL